MKMKNTKKNKDEISLNMCVHNFLMPKKIVIDNEEKLVLICCRCGNYKIPKEIPEEAGVLLNEN